MSMVWRIDRAGSAVVCNGDMARLFFGQLITAPSARGNWLMLPVSQSHETKWKIPSTVQVACAPRQMTRRR